MKNSEMIHLLNASTIAALLKVYNLSYKHIAFRLHCTRQNVMYLLKNDKFKDSQHLIVLELLQQNGLEATELVLIN